MNDHCVVIAKRNMMGGGVASVKQHQEAKAVLNFVLDPSAQLLQPLADFVNAYAKARYHPRTAERVALASHELVDNAMSYGSVSADINFCLYESHRTVELSVINQSSGGRISTLQAQLERLGGDPEQVYEQEMAKSMSGTGGRVSLGLARISHEAQMDIEFRLEGIRVVMTARCPR